MRAVFSVLTLVILLSGIAAAGNMTDMKFINMDRFQIDSLLTVTAAKDLPVTDRMQFYSGIFLDMPYNLICAGDGADALYETYPLVNFKETNCMVFVEHVLALSISDSWDNFFNNLQQIRYKNGIIGMRTRNHYTMADWLPENDWLLEDATAKVASDKAEQVTGRQNILQWSSIRKG